MKRSSMPSRKKIAEFWMKTLVAFDKDGQPGIEDGECCFACGRIHWLERCHIVPHWRGGTETVDNLHVLCKVCHLFSENYSGSDYWRWFREVPFYLMTDHHHRGWLVQAVLSGVRSPEVNALRARMEREGTNVEQAQEVYRRLGNGAPSTF